MEEAARKPGRVNGCRKRETLDDPLLTLPDGEEARARAAREIARGRVISFRTDTFYGLGADPFNREAVAAVGDLKGREGKPVLVVVADEGSALRLASRATTLFRQVAARHWPGPLTLVVEARPEVPEELTAGTGTVGVRLPGDAEVRALLGACGGALTATSANPTGHPPARTAGEVARYFPAGLALVVDGGPARTDAPSTVLDVTGPRPRLIREGVVTRAELEETFRQLGVALG